MRPGRARTRRKRHAPPPAEQDELARELIGRIEADERWDKLFADPRSSALLDEMVREARADIAAGRVRDCDTSTKAE